MVAEFIEAVIAHNFMSRALIASIIVGIMAGAIGCFIILRGMALMGDAISHSVIPGVAISHLLGISHIIGATVFGLLASMAIGFISEKSKLKKDTIIGIVFSSFFALGIIMISRIRSTADLHNVLFGNVLTVNQDDIRIIAVVAVLLLVYIVLFYKELLLTSFDETLAKVYGLKTRAMHYSFLFVLTLVVVSSLQVVGAVLIVAMIITPAATSYLLTTRLPIMILLASTIGAISSVVGMFFSFSFNFPAGSTIVVVLAVIFVTTLLCAPKNGLIYQKK